MATYDLVIIGAGNLGLWTAHQLAARGFGRIAVCERSWAGFGATTRSAGVVRQQGGSETAIKLGQPAVRQALRDPKPFLASECPLAATVDADPRRPAARRRRASGNGPKDARNCSAASRYTQNR